MEIGVKQTERHMMYSNPAAFGPSTSTGSFDWNEMLCAGPGAATTLTAIEYGVGATASLEPNNFDIAAIDGKFIGTKISQILKPKDTKAEVEIIYQSIGDLHISCPNHNGDWYFTGNYPTPGGNKVVTKAFINYVEGNKKRAY